MLVHVLILVHFSPHFSRDSILPGVEGGAPVETQLGRWLRFNDTLVDEFVLNDSALEAECFGGSYKPKADGREPVSRVHEL